MSDDYEPFTIAQILDSTTIVIVGNGVESLRPEEELQIVATGLNIPGLNVPLVVPKAHVEVSNVAGLYALARTTTFTTQESSPNLASIGAALAGVRTVTKRRQLDVTESQVVGNPANKPVAVGDFVIRPDDLPRLVNFLQRQRARPSE